VRTSGMDAVCTAVTGSVCAQAGARRRAQALTAAIAASTASTASSPNAVSDVGARGRELRWGNVSKLLLPEGTWCDVHRQRVAIDAC
jgi:hypothetical protein